MTDIPPMPHGGTHTNFYTVRLRDPGQDLLTRHINLLRLAVRLSQARRPFRIDDAVILPDRMHMIWTLPPDDADAAARWRSIKGTFARHLPPAAGRTRATAQDIWQRRYWDCPVRTPDALVECLDLIRMAPVIAGLVSQPQDWPHSKAGRVLADTYGAPGPALTLVQARP